MVSHTCIIVIVNVSASEIVNRTSMSKMVALFMGSVDEAIIWSWTNL